LRPMGDDHFELRGNDVQPFGGFFPDLVHRSATARTIGALRRNDHMFPRQMRRKRRTPALALSPLTWMLLLPFSLALGYRLFDLFQREVQLPLIQLLAFAPEPHPLMLFQQLAYPFAERRQFLTFRSKRIALKTRGVALRHRLERKCAQCLYVLGQRISA